MAVSLSLRHPVVIPLEVEGVLPAILSQMSADEIANLLISQGNARLPLGEFFTVSGSCADDLTVAWEGDLLEVKRIGQGMSHGRILVRGPAGMHVGAEMTGGSIEIHGDAGDWAGAEMRGGLLQIHGSAGDCLGGAYRGSRRGMTGGEILVSGDAGDETGRVMRRGLIAIGGRCGEFCGSRMIAGSILVGGPAGRRPGAGMKRGTIGLLAPQRTELLPTFQRAGVFRASFLAGYAQRLRALGMDALAGLIPGRVERWCGDRLALGLGEIVLPSG